MVVVEIVGCEFTELTLLILKLAYFRTRIAWKFCKSREGYVYVMGGRSYFLAKDVECLADVRHAQGTS